MILPDQITTSASTSTTTTTVQNPLPVVVPEENADGVEVYNPNISNWDKPFMRSAMSADNGTGSTARLGTLSIVWSTMLVLFYLVVATGSIPGNIMSLGYFSALLICVIYSPTKITDIIRAYFARKS